MDFNFLSPPATENGIALYDYWVHVAEVIVQFVAVILLYRAVTLARRANESAALANATANAALKGAQKDFAEERKEYARAMSDQRYDVLDKTYMDLVLMRVEHPEFNEPERLYARDVSADSAVEKRRYQSYAFALFNYLETIADKCHAEIEEMEKGDEGKETNMRIETPDLIKTWGPILVSETWQHERWFRDGESRVDDRFKPEFRKLVGMALENKSIDPLELLKTSYA